MSISIGIYQTYIELEDTCNHAHMEYINQIFHASNMLNKLSLAFITRLRINNLFSKYFIHNVLTV